MPHYRLFRDVIDSLGPRSEFGGDQDPRAIAASPAYPAPFHFESFFDGRRVLVVPLALFDANLVICESRTAPDCTEDDGTVLVASAPDGLRNVNHPFSFVSVSLEKVLSAWKESRVVESEDVISPVFGEILTNVRAGKDPLHGL